VERGRRGGVRRRNGDERGGEKGEEGGMIACTGNGEDLSKWVRVGGSEMCDSWGCRIKYTHIYRQL
jgi:hypothetical protein